jgi:quercetin dioxygenase-like cupin family protein
MRATTFVLATGFATGIVSVVQAQAVGQQPATAPPAPSGIQTRILLRSGSNAEGAQIEYPAVAQPEVTATFTTLQPGAKTPRHMHPVPIFVYVLEGTLEHRADGRQPRTYAAGEAFVEGQNLWHEAANTSGTPTKLLGVIMGEQGKPFTVIHKGE